MKLTYDNIVPFRPQSEAERGFRAAIAPRAIPIVTREARLAKALDDLVFAVAQHGAACAMGDHDRIRAAMERMYGLAIAGNLVLRSAAGGPSDGGAA